MLQWQHSVNADQFYYFFTVYILIASELYYIIIVLTFSNENENTIYCETYGNIEKIKNKITYVSFII